MSFIISFQGQFRPYQIPEGQSIRAKNVNHGDSLKQLKDHEEDDFENVLAQKKGLGDPSNKKRAHAMEAYQKQTKGPRRLALARNIMSSPVFFMKDDQSLAQAREELKKKTFRHFPILNKEGVLCGIISDRDILGSRSGNILDIMQKEVLTAYEDTYVNDLARIMLFENIHSLPILNREKQISGIVTNTDILRLISDMPHFDFEI